MGNCKSEKKEIVYTKYEQVTTADHLLKVLSYNILLGKEKLKHYPKEKVINYIHHDIKKDIRGKFGSVFGSIIGGVVVDGSAWVGGEQVIETEYSNAFDKPIKNSVEECFNNKKAVIDVGPMFEKVDLNDIDSKNVFLFGFSYTLSFQYFMETFREKILEFPEKTENNLKLIVEAMILIQNAYDKWIRRDNKEEIHPFMKAYLEHSINVFTSYD